VLPSLKLEQPKDYLDERTPVLKFSKLRVGKSNIMKIVLKNDG
jgi:hydrocephalus-inducing protein